jgi:hypothetical protein
VERKNVIEFRAETMVVDGGWLVGTPIHLPETS